MKFIPDSIVAVVVTFNRKDLLLHCIKALLHQTVSCDVLIVDNASTDGTMPFLREKKILDDNRIHYLRLQKNVGGSGGFHQGVKYCMEKKWNWFWFMDDDAMPEKKALGNLFSKMRCRHCIYGSVAIGLRDDQKRLCFPAKTILKSMKGGYKFIDKYDDLHDISNVAWLPFLGFLIHRSTVKKIGLPDPDFFILDDDIEYSERARNKGIDILLIKSSIIVHPLPLMTFHRIFGKRIIYQSMPPWKAYYGSRNKVIVAKKYYGELLWLQTIPGILFRAFWSLFYERKGLYSLYANIIGIVDGLLGNKGRKILPVIKSSSPTHKTNDSTAALTPLF